MIVCGWCGQPTANRDRCTSCGHIDPERPYAQRGESAPVLAGRTDIEDLRKRLAEARRELTSRGLRPTVERMAESLDVSPRTVRRWQTSIQPVMTNAVAGPQTATPRGVR